MGNDEVIRAETARDIVAARAEIIGRRDQVAAEYGGRLAALDQLAADLEAGEVNPKAAQTRIRRILGGDRTATSERKAGRTKIGMSVPTAKPTQPLPQTPAHRSGPSPARAHLSISKVLAQIDQRIIRVLRIATSHTAREEARFELSLLLQLRRSLESYGEEVPSDVVLLGSVVELTEQAESTLTDLEGGGPDRVKRLVGHNGAIASELVALGGQVGNAKEQIAKARAQLDAGDGDPQLVFEQALRAFAALQLELEKRYPVQKASLLDDLLRI